MSPVRDHAKKVRSLARWSRAVDPLLGTTLEKASLTSTGAEPAEAEEEEEEEEDWPEAAERGGRWRGERGRCGLCGKEARRAARLAAKAKVVGVLLKSGMLLAVLCWQKRENLNLNLFLI